MSLVRRSSSSGGGSGPFNPLYITANTYFELVGNDLNLYVNGELRETWTTAVAPGTTGSPIGLLLGLTYS